jgi:translation initiation factor 1
MSKKLDSLSDLAHIQFDGLAPDPPEPTLETESEFTKQYLEAHFSKKGRAGKVVTLIKGFEGEAESLKELAKILKQTVNTGGTVKNGEILIQGNYRDQIIEKLQAMGHEVKRIGG